MDSALQKIWFERDETNLKAAMFYLHTISYDPLARHEDKMMNSLSKHE